MKRLLIICLAVILALVSNLLVLPAQPAMAAYKEVIKLDGANGKFGTSVAASGDTIVVGAPTNFLDEGKADVFVRSGGVWALQQGLSSTPTGLGYSGTRWFGASVAIEGDTIVVGAPYDNDEGNNAGAAWVFVRSGGTWTEQQKLTASDGAASDLFGNVVNQRNGTLFEPNTLA